MPRPLYQQHAASLSLRGKRKRKKDPNTEERHSEARAPSRQRLVGKNGKEEMEQERISPQG